MLTLRSVLRPSLRLSIRSNHPRFSHNNWTKEPEGVKVAHKRVGEGPVYQGRYKSFVVQSGEHLLTVCRYVERNAARASLVQRAEDWRWSSLWRWREGGEGRETADETPPLLVLSTWPTGGLGTQASDGSGRPRHWLGQVNTPQHQAELDALRRAVQKCRPYGGEQWCTRIIGRFDLTSTTRDRGRPMGAD